MIRILDSLHSPPIDPPPQTRGTEVGVPLSVAGWFTGHHDIVVLLEYVYLLALPRGIYLEVVGTLARTFLLACLVTYIMLYTTCDPYLRSIPA